MATYGKNPFSDVGVKADQLDKEDSQPRAAIAAEKNFPPLPSFCCFGPCFYHDIKVEIPSEYQRTCRAMFILWQLYVFCLFFNCISAFSLLCIGLSNGTMFGLALAYLLLFTPLSFLLWYRRIYQALKNGKSFHYMTFFLVFFFQIVINVLYAIGITFLGTCGWINAIWVARSDKKGKTGVAVLFFISAALWTLLAILKILALRKIHEAYRTSGASFAQAQKEITTASVHQVQSAVVKQPEAYVPTPFQ